MQVDLGSMGWRDIHTSSSERSLKVSPSGSFLCWRNLVLKAWFPEQQQQHHLGTGYNASGPSPDTLNQTLGRGPSPAGFHKPFSGSWCKSTTDENHSCRTFFWGLHLSLSVPSLALCQTEANINSQNRYLCRETGFILEIHTGRQSRFPLTTHHATCNTRIPYPSS